VLVTGVGTGGTVTGTGRYLKERKPDLQIVGADPIGSIYSSEQVQSYLVEGVGEDFWPTTFDRDIVDRWFRVSDREAFSTTRRLARLEGILIGASGGMALHAALRVATELPPDKTVLVILPDGGRPYLSKVFDDAWMIQHGFLARPGAAPTVAGILHAKVADVPDVPSLVAVSSRQRVGEAIDLLQRYGISQMPVVRDQDGDALAAEVSTAMAPPLAVVRAADSVDAVFGDLQERPAVVVAEGARPIGVLTRSDLLEYLAHASRR